MAKTPKEKVYEEIYEADPIELYEKADTGSSAAIRIRLVKADTEPKLRLDFRQHIVSARYTGFTGRGIAISLEQTPKFLKGLNELIAKAKSLKEKKTKK